MKRILVLGSGRVAGPLVAYLLRQPGITVTVASQEIAQAQALVRGEANGSATRLLADDIGQLGRSIEAHDLAVSLLPPKYHPIVAELCIEHRANLVTASYISPEMERLDDMARRAGVTLLNEVGLDPGIDHMSAMRLIDGVVQRGGRVTCFESYCGGLPAPDSNDNPFGYKFSWSPRGVLAAGRKPARWREDGKEIVVPGPRLFDKFDLLQIEGVGQFEAYPNRDSMGYIKRYKLEGVDTIHRGTLRYPGWCDTWRKIIELGLLDDSPTTYPAGTTYADFLSSFVRATPPGPLRQRLAAQLNVGENAPVLDRLEWLGMFEETPIAVTGKGSTPLDILADRLELKLRYQPGQRDMIVLRHEVEAAFSKGAKERIHSTLVAYGVPDGVTAMSRTVGIPAAIAAKQIATGRYSLPGVQIPVTPHIYNPVLDELTEMGLTFTETVETLETVP
jgi:saccharopine dehydrogenase (NADP+, L-glutamate forming)/spermidine synthase